MQDMCSLNTIINRFSICMLRRIRRSLERFSNELDSSHPVEPGKEGLYKSLLTSFLGLAFFIFLFAAPEMRATAEEIGDYSGMRTILAFSSLLISFILSGASASSSSTSTEKILDLIFLDFRINYFVIRDLASFVYFIGVATSLFFFMNGFMIEEAMMILLPFPCLLLLRVLLEMQVASFVTAESSSIISTSLEPMSGSIQSCAEHTSSIDRKLPEPPKVTSSW